MRLIATDDCLWIRIAINIIYNNNNKIQFDMYEIDTKIKMLDDIPKNVIYRDFIEVDIKKKI